VTVQDGLALDGGTVRLASTVTSATYLYFSGTQSVTGTGELVFASGGNTNPAYNVVYVNSSSTVTVGSGITVRGGAGLIRGWGASSSVLVFDGRLVPDVAGRTIELGPGLAIDGLGTASLQVDPGPGTVQLAGATIRDTRIEGSGKLVGQSGTLSNATLATTFELAAGASVTVQDGLALDGGTVRLASTVASATYLYFSGTQSVTGTGELVFASGGVTSTGYNNLYLISGASLTLTPGITVRGGAGRIDGPGTFVNQGTILADVEGRTLSIEPTTFTNQGTIGARGAGTGVATLALVMPSVDGTILAGAGGLVTRSGALALAPTARVEVEIGGTANEMRGRLAMTSGSATLGGTLAAQLVNAFAPTLGQRFGVLAGSYTGSFATLEGLSIGGGLVFALDADPNDLGLEVIAE